MDKKTLEFVTYCIGKLSVLHKLPQKEIYKRLKTSVGQASDVCALHYEGVDRMKEHMT